MLLVISFFFSIVRVTGLASKFLAVSFEQQNPGLKSTELLSQQECLCLVDSDLFSAELHFRAMGEIRRRRSN